MRNGILRATLVALSIAACGAAQPELRMPTDATSGVAISNVSPNQPRSVGSMSLCLTAPGTATITGVALHEPMGDIRVEVFAVRPSPFSRGLDAVGTDTRPLAAIAGGFDPDAVQQVSVVCPSEMEMAGEDIGMILNEFAVQVSWSSGDMSGGSALDVTYLVGGEERTAVIPFGIWLCAATCPDGLASGAGTS